MTDWNGGHGWTECVETLLPNNSPEKRFMESAFSEQEVEILTRNLDPDKLFEVKRFLSLVRKDGEMPDQSNPHYKGLTQCWRWKWKTKNYPIVYTYSRRGTVAYRISYNLFKGQIPKGMCVMHRCDNKQCTNPDHLELGTNVQNLQDAHKRGLVKKGRMRTKKGIQSIYAACKIHNSMVSFENTAKLNYHIFQEAVAFFKTDTWRLLKRDIEKSFLALIYIHCPEMVDDSLRHDITRFLNGAKRESCDFLLKNDPSKIQIISPSSFTPELDSKITINYCHFESLDPKKMILKLA